MTQRILNLTGAGLALLAAACGGSDSTTLEGSRGDERILQQCRESAHRVVTTDANSDKKPDILHLYDGSRHVCAKYDMNFDGKVDISRFFASDGRTAVREHHDFDFDGRIDQIAF